MIQAKVGDYLVMYHHDHSDGISFTRHGNYINKIKFPILEIQDGLLKILLEGTRFMTASWAKGNTYVIGTKYATVVEIEPAVIKFCEWCSK